MFHSESKLFTPFQIGDVAVAHRVVLAPLTRMRSDAGAIPSELMVEYYSQRTSEGGLLIAEATAVSRTGQAYLGAPGIFSEEQTKAWAKVVDAVHTRKGKIFLQLWHGGRTGHLEFAGEVPVGPSTVPYEGATYIKQGWVATTPNRALATSEIAGLIGEFKQAAVRAKLAGFDGVELHGANGYLFDQFLQDGSNQRTDLYGGSIENRARLLLEATDEVIQIWGSGRVGVRLSPSGTFNGMSDSNAPALFGYVAEKLAERKLAYLHVIQPRVSGSEDVKGEADSFGVSHIRKVYRGPIIAAGGYEPSDAIAAVEHGTADLIAFGRHFISNPDLPERIARDLPLNPYDRASFYGGDARGYTDYPRIQE